jgi:hypothetical protein
MFSPIAQAIRSGEPMKGKPPMDDKIRIDLGRVLVDAAVGTPEYRAALQSLRSRAEEAIVVLESFGELNVGGDPASIARRTADLYEALSEGLGNVKLASAEAEALLDPYTDEKIALAHDAEAIFAALPKRTQSLVQRLEALNDEDRLDDEGRRAFRLQPDVAAWDDRDADALAPWGVGPVAIWFARKGIVDMLGRARRTKAFDPRGPNLKLTPEGVIQASRVVIPASSIGKGIVSQTQLSESVTQTMYAWFLYAGGFVRTLLPGWICRGLEEGSQATLEITPESKSRLSSTGSGGPGSFSGRELAIMVEEHNKAISDEEQQVVRHNERVERFREA